MDIANKITAADKELVAKIHGVSVDYIYKILTNKRAPKNRIDFIKTCEDVINAREKYESDILHIRQTELARLMTSLSTEHNPK